MSEAIEDIAVRIYNEDPEGADADPCSYAVKVARAEREAWTRATGYGSPEHARKCLDEIKKAIAETRAVVMARIK